MFVTWLTQTHSYLAQAISNASFQIGVRAEPLQSILIRVWNNYTTLYI